MSTVPPVFTPNYFLGALTWLNHVLKNCGSVVDKKLFPCTFLIYLSMRFLYRATDSVSGVSRPAKVGALSLPTEYQLMQLVNGIENPHATWSSGTPACEWRGVKCNEAGKVVDIRWDSMDLRGVFNCDHLSSELKVLIVHRNELSGEVSFNNLPAELTALYLVGTFFS